MKIGGASSVAYMSEVRNGKPSLPKSAGTPETSPLSKLNDEAVLSKKADNLLNLRSISELEKKQFSGILSRASAVESAVQKNPKEFLKTLSPTEMDLLRRAHSLADPIDISSLSDEGAQNLLVEPGAAQDLDNNGLTMVGKANTIAFPPRNAPASFKAAWEEATEGMSFADIPMHLPFMIGLANIHVDEKGAVTAYEPTDPEWRNPFADANYDYSTKIKEIVSGIRYQHSLGQMTDDRYKQEMGFYSRLKAGMTKFQTSNEIAA